MQLMKRTVFYSGNHQTHLIQPYTPSHWCLCYHPPTSRLQPALEILLLHLPRSARQASFPLLRCLRRRSDSNFDNHALARNASQSRRIALKTVARIGTINPPANFRARRPKLGGGPSQDFIFDITRMRPARSEAETARKSTDHRRAGVHKDCERSPRVVDGGRQFIAHLTLITCSNIRGIWPCLYVSRSVSLTLRFSPSSECVKRPNGYGYIHPAKHTHASTQYIKLPRLLVCVCVCGKGTRIYSPIKIQITLTRDSQWKIHAAAGDYLPAPCALLLRRRARGLPAKIDNRSGIV